MHGLARRVDDRALPVPAGGGVGGAAQDSRAAEAGLPPDHPTLPSILKKSGYHTALIGKWHLGMPPDYGPRQSGYEYFFGFRSGAVDYFTHKSGPAATGAEDLWEGDEMIRHAGYLT